MKSAKFLLIVTVLAAGLVACSSGPLKWYEEGSIDEADAVLFNISQERVTVHIDGKKVAIRHSEVLLAPGTYSLRVEANTSFDRNPNSDDYDKLIANLRARDVPYATMMEKPDAPIEVVMEFIAGPGKRYRLFAEFIERPMAASQPDQRIPGEFVVYIEEDF